MAEWLVWMRQADECVLASDGKLAREEKRTSVSDSLLVTAIIESQRGRSWNYCIVLTRADTVILKADVSSGREWKVGSRR